MTSISGGDLARPFAAGLLAGIPLAARGLAARLVRAACARIAERAARRDLLDRPAWMLRDIGLTHRDVAEAVAGRISRRD